MNPITERGWLEYDEADVLDEIDADVRAINPDAPIVHMSASEPVDAELLDRIVGY